MTPEDNPEAILRIIKQLEDDISVYKPALEKYKDGECSKDDVIEALESTEVLKKI